MNRRTWKEKVAENIAEIAIEKAKTTVGKSMPLIIYEVEVPEELKLHAENEEA